MRDFLLIGAIVLVPIILGLLYALVHAVTPKDRTQEDEEQMTFLRDYYKRKDAKK